MKKLTYTITQEPVGPVYHGLLGHAAAKGYLGLLVVGSELPLSPEGQNVLRELTPFIRQIIPSSEWPGTQLLGTTALVHYFTLCQAAALILQRSSDRLFQWLQPDLPEDLCLLKSLDEPWLVSISHERDAYLLLEEPELPELLKEIPGLKTTITSENSEGDSKGTGEDANIPESGH